MTHNSTLPPDRAPEDQGNLSPPRFPRPWVALCALVVSTVGGVIGLFLVFAGLELRDRAYSGDPIRLILASVIWTFPLAFLVLTVGLMLVLVGIYVDQVRGKATLRLWWCLVVGALFGLLHSMSLAAAYYDPDDFIGERDPGWFGYWLQDGWMVLAMTVPGIFSGATFWLVSRLLSRKRATID